MYIPGTTCFHSLLAHPCLYYDLLSPQYNVLYILLYCTFYSLFFHLYLCLSSCVVLHILHCPFVMNLVYELNLTHHQRSLAHHMYSCTTLTVALHLRLQFPSSIALTTHSWLHWSHTLYISLGLPLCHGRVLFSVQHSPKVSYLPSLSVFVLCSVSCIVLRFSLSEC